MAPFFANRSCDPVQSGSAQRVFGTYVEYAVGASEPTDAMKALDFADKQNIKIVIRNTGHDYNGKSTGAGSLGLAIVGGECPTIGLAGGYTQGGGRSALSSKYGLAADQTLE
ncbi:hypothetical protein LTR16_001824 [Cryomyces antarcticus]|uniref:FAD linked oxidase N-terminal domain-containing protein n=1 Tax=Cryomyces antarcticus TaxID=329879 RepID=A0ABR0LPY8_9PEZI|nr:hypothetical protein LTR39_002167 [Cryomyces antarcticus]KAK5019502.1 hypothetical protein LTR60_001099 [Cryomyces antarcticus]KAK5201679.1 hypothetical protein LTR16_001824 [Cryomyces antarcticus]